MKRKSAFAGISLLLILAACQGLGTGSPVASPVPTAALPAVDRIAFVAEDSSVIPHIYVVNVDRGELMRIPDDGEGYNPAWSPDGQSIAFVGAYGLALAELNSNQLNYLADFRNEEMPPIFGITWSPDGRQIAYSVCHVDEANIYVLSVDMKRIDGKLKVNASVPKRITSQHVSALGLTWSPNGRQIGFYWNEMDAPVNIAVIDVVEGLKSKNGVVRDDLAEGMTLSWSPDGDRIVFSSIRYGVDVRDIKGDELHIINADGSNEMRLAESGSCPVWLPPGDQIAYVSRSIGANGKVNDEIYLVNANGSQPKKLTDLPSGTGCPVWSPDGKRIAFLSDRDGQDEIYVMNTDGSNVRRLTNSVGFIRWPLVWQPRPSSAP